MAVTVQVYSVLGVRCRTMFGRSSYEKRCSSGTARPPPPGDSELVASQRSKRQATGSVILTLCRVNNTTPRTACVSWTECTNAYRVRNAGDSELTVVLTERRMKSPEDVIAWTVNSKPSSHLRCVRTSKILHGCSAQPIFKNVNTNLFPFFASFAAPNVHRITTVYGLINRLNSPSSSGQKFHSDSLQLLYSGLNVYTNMKVFHSIKQSVRLCMQT